MSIEVSRDGMVGTPAISASRGYWWLAALAFAAIASVLWIATFVGYTSSDDSGYLEGGRGWLHGFPYVGVVWWHLRHPTVIPIAISIGLLGENEHALVLPSLLYEIGIVLIAFKFLERFVDRAAGLVAAVLLVTMPIGVMQSSIAGADLPMVFFAGLSAWLFLLAIEAKDRRWQLLLAAGLSAGMAQLAHEVTISLLLVYGVLFLAGFGIPRRLYWIMAGGFAAVTLVDMAYYGLAAGNPFYRFDITLSNAHIADRPAMTGIGFDGTGALRIHPLIDPLLVVFARIDFGLLFFLLIPAAIWQIRRPAGAPGRSVGHVMLLVALGSFLFCAVTLRDKQLLTRYYSLTAVAAAVVVALWMGQALWPRRKRLFALVLAAIVGTNLLALAMTNKSPRFAEHTLIEYLSTHEGDVVVDPELAMRAQVLLGWAGDTGRVRADPPKPGDAYYYNPKTSSAVTGHLSAAELPLFQPKDDWPILWRHEQEKSGIARLLQAAHFDRVLPGAIRSRLDHPSPAVTVFRVPGAQP